MKTPMKIINSQSHVVENINYNFVLLPGGQNGSFSSGK